ncbi:response regulator [Paenibacillus aurantiacus]|uniref:Response regulator n=1 Tax=Paenibacillus aurantiacus TaxID=1936118 RepID=A0ABV5KXD3_9BACL
MRKLLIVDDEKNIRAGLKAMIEREFPGGYVFDFAADGEEALARIDETGADLVITDIRMPVMDGMALIDALHARKERPDVIILSGHDDFQYAKAAIRYEVREYLLKPIVREELFGVLRRMEAERQRKETAAGAMRDSAAIQAELAATQLNLLFMEQLVHPADVRERLVKAGLGWLDEGFYVGVVKSGEELQGDDRAKWIARVEELTCLSDEERSLRFYDKDGKLVLICGRSEPLERLAVQYRPQNRFRAGRSGRLSGMEMVRTGYEQAARALKYSLLHSGSGVVHYSDIGGKEVMEKVPLQDIHKIANMLGSGRDAEMNRLLQHVLDIRLIMRYDISYLEGISRALNEHVFDRVFRQYGEESVDILKLHKQVGDLYSFDQFHDYYRSVESLLQLVSDYVGRMRHVHHERGDLQRAIDYIHEHYQRDLNMAMVSNYVSLNYSYFSQAFKDYTGETFVSYLRKLRMQKAKELLAGTNMKVYEISEQAGFDNVKHFTRVFREMEGVTPLEYRAVREPTQR